MQPRSQSDGKRVGPSITVLIARPEPCSRAAAGAQPTAATKSGTFTGVPAPSAAGIDVFFGIRYAASPAGTARWTPPQLPTSLPGPTLADVPGPACPQPGSTAPQSEDCLFLNIYVPASANEHSRLWVFFWIHGGALVTGTIAIYDPSVIVAEKNIVVVTINYRLAALGSAMRAPSEDGPSAWSPPAGPGGSPGAFRDARVVVRLKRSLFDQGACRSHGLDPPLSRHPRGRCRRLQSAD